MAQALASHAMETRLDTLSRVAKNEEISAHYIFMAPGLQYNAVVSVKKW